MSDEVITQVIDLTGLQDKVYTALDMLLSNDKGLIEAGVGPAPIAHKLGQYLQVLFSGWDVDCWYDAAEYQAIAARVAELFTAEPGRERANPYPAVIVHHRGTEERLLVVEVSKSSEGKQVRELDERKTYSYLKNLNYKLGLHLTLDTDNSLGQPYAGGWQIGNSVSNF